MPYKTPPDASCAAAITTEYILPGAITAWSVPMARIALELEHAPLPLHVRRKLETTRRRVPRLPGVAFSEARRSRAGSV
jgi:hypothetical protein